MATKPRLLSANALWLGAVALVFFGLALSDAIYDATSPSGWPLHVLARKLYSVPCFALVGFLFCRTTSRSSALTSAIRAAVVVALYSAAIEIGQRLTGSHEGLRSNAVDVALGFIGGALGGLLASVRPRAANGEGVWSPLAFKRRSDTTHRL